MAQPPVLNGLAHWRCCCIAFQVLDQDYDWVFGSDVTYSEEALLPLAKLLRQIVLTNEQCVVKLAHMHRSKELDKAMRETFHGGPQHWACCTLLIDG